MSLPLAKLGLLAFRTLSKPIASRLKQQANNYPKFRQFILNLAQANYLFKTNNQRRFYGQTTDDSVRALNEEKAIQAATDLLGEIFLFSVVAGAAVIFEVQRSARSEARREELRRQELERIMSLGSTLDLKQDRILELA
ncbi:OPA3-like protein isoform X2 [Canna indica]|uniref:OPA3-like protein isoform X2 n=1 Tax=Canna indica TaxID=4628 RepID=A0AAQ3QK30_9LILI|nr:OPA3-like protein isoform X2 [Canna indica]